MRNSHSRRTFSKHALQYGCCLTSEKMHAVIAGDLSGTVVHRAFVHVAQVFGSLLWQHDHRTVFMLATPLEEEHLRCLLTSLQDIDPVTEIHVRYILACYYLLKNQAKEGDDQLVLAADIVRTHHLNFPTSSIEGQAPTEEQRDLVNTLAHLIYLDRCSAFVFPTMIVRLSPDFDASFKNTAVSCSVRHSNSITAGSHLSVRGR